MHITFNFKIKGGNSALAISSFNGVYFIFLNLFNLYACTDERITLYRNYLKKIVFLTTCMIKEREVITNLQPVFGKKKFKGGNCTLTA